MSMMCLVGCSVCLALVLAVNGVGSPTGSASPIGERWVGAMLSCRIVNLSSRFKDGRERDGVHFKESGHMYIGTCRIQWEFSLC